MNILVCSWTFFPSIGGIETTTQLLCRQWKRMGHKVTIVTHTPGDSIWEGIRVHRQPAWKKVWRLLSDHDIYWQNNISLHYLFPLLLCPRPWFATAQLWPSLTSSAFSPVSLLKHFVLLFAHNIYISKTVSCHHLWPGVVIPNPVELCEWDSPMPLARDIDVVFLGRLVEGKGCKLLLDSLVLLRREQSLRVTIIGSGPQQPYLELMTLAYGLTDFVRFTGSLQGAQLVNEMRRHRLAVIPSLWEEPFGVVALEAIAAGCVPLISPRGGLREAVGPCGVQISSLTPHGLANSMAMALAGYEELKASLDSFAIAHLQLHSSELIATRYLDIFARETLENQA